MIGTVPKESIEQMIGMKQTSPPLPLTFPAVSPHPSDQKRDPGVVNFARPTDPHWTPLPVPDRCDSLQTIADKMKALASVITTGDSMMTWTDGKMLDGWDSKIAMKNSGAEGILTYQELVELQTIKKVRNVAITRENEVRAELKKLKRDLEASRKILEGRKRDMKAKIRTTQTTSKSKKRKWEGDA